MPTPPASPPPGARPSRPPGARPPAAATLLLAAALALVSAPPGAVGQTAPAPPETTVLSDAERTELLGELRQVYVAWRTAIIGRHTDQWQATTSEHRRHQVHNEIVSNGGAYPEALFHVIQPPPQLGPLRIADVRLGPDAARLTFFGPLHYDPATAPDPTTQPDLMQVVYHRDPGGWAVDRISHVSLANRPQWRQDFLNLNYTALAGPEFAFDKTKPDPPELCQPPEHIAMLQIFASGYRVSADVNGHRYPEVNDGNVHFIVIGGLRNGANQLALEMHPVDHDDLPQGAAGRHLAVNLWVRAAQPDEDSSRVFHYMPPQGQAPQRHSATVEVNPRTLAEGRR